MSGGGESDLGGDEWGSDIGRGLLRGGGGWEEKAEEDEEEEGKKIRGAERYRMAPGLAAPGSTVFGCWLGSTDSCLALWTHFCDLTKT